MVRSRIGFTCVLAAASLAQAAPAPLPARQRAELITQLDATDAEAAAKAAARLADVAEAHAALAAALGKGPPAPTAIALVAALGKRPAATDLPLIIRYASHRNPEVRAQAITTLGALARDPAAQAAIVAGLHDDAAGARAAAAQAAVTAKLRAAIAPLTVLAERGDQAAIDALAQLQPPPAGGK